MMYSQVLPSYDFSKNKDEDKRKDEVVISDADPKEFNKMLIKFKEEERKNGNRT